MASWGMLASDALSGLRSFPYQLFFPALRDWYYHVGI